MSGTRRGEKERKAQENKAAVEIARVTVIVHDINMRMAWRVVEFPERVTLGGMKL